MSNADALICEYENLQEKYKHLPIFKRAQAANALFSPNEIAKIYDRKRELAAIEATKAISAEQTAQTKTVEKAEQTDVKLVEFDFEGEYFLIEEQVKNQILNQISSLYQQNKIMGEASKKSLKILMAEIFYYVANAGSKAPDASQLKRFFIARKLCLNGTWERPKGLERQASILREQKWQQEKLNEYKWAKAFTESIKNVA